MQLEKTLLAAFNAASDKAENEKDPQAKHELEWLATLLHALRGAFTEEGTTWEQDDFLANLKFPTR